MKLKKAQTQFRKLYAKLIHDHGDRKATAMLAFWTADYLDDLEMVDMLKSHFAKHCTRKTMTNSGEK